MSASPSILLDFCCCIDLRCQGLSLMFGWKWALYKRSRGLFAMFGGLINSFWSRFFAILFHRRCGGVRLTLVPFEAVFGLNLLCLLALISALLDLI